VFAVGKILLEETKRYGIVSGKELSKGLMLVDKLVEKPNPEDAPSLLGILGRYIFTPEIFKYQREVKAESGDEIQLTDAMQKLARNTALYSWTFGGKRYDIGTMKDWLQSHFELSLQSEFSIFLDKIDARKT
jgi:UTP--glucose-1-phosphate uridylyltransferase